MDVPLPNPYISPIYSGYLWVIYNPQESLEYTINTMGTLLEVHPIVPWKSMVEIEYNRITYTLRLGVKFQALSRPVFDGFLGHKFHTMLEDSGIDRCNLLVSCFLEKNSKFHPFCYI